MGIKIGVGVVLGLLMLGVVVVWLLKRWMEQPLYVPGSVHAGRDLSSPLDPPTAQQQADGLVDVGGGVRLWSFVDGQGSRVVVVHGGPGIPTPKAWTGLHSLTNRFAFTYYHQRGCGRSTRPFERLPPGNTYHRMRLLHRTLGLPAQIGDIERLRRVWGEERLTLIGHSFGGLIATLYAAEFPERVRALVLVAPAPLVVMPPEDGGLLEEVRRLLPAAEQARYQAFLDRYLDFRHILDSDERSVASLNSEFGEFYARAARLHGIDLPGQAFPEDGGGFVVAALYLSLGQRHDWSAILRDVPAPVLVVHGERDLQSEQASRSYCAHLPHTRFEVIRGAGHFPFEDRPEAFAAVIGGFLDGL
jgi:proline iminopeptidase